MALTQRTCRRCLLPESVPGIGFDDSSLCSVCQVTPSEADLAECREELRRDLDSLITAHQNVEPYACVVAFSGGKDSAYTLKLLVERYHLRCLAVTIDNGFLSNGNTENCRAVCGRLGVDHILYTPNTQFVRKMYGISAVREDMHAPAAVQRASSICNSCISLINTHILRTAQQVRAPLVAGGYLGGQLPRETSAMTIRPGRPNPTRAAMVRRFVQAFGDEARPYFTFHQTFAPADQVITVINPMLGFAVPEDELLHDLATLGWKRPRDTGLTSTNCRLNDLGVYLHHRRHGFHAYALEIADQLRHGLISRDEAERKLSTIPERRDIDWLAEKIGVSSDGL